MRSLTIVPVLLGFLLLTSCVSVRVVADYDTQANFSEYSSFAFYKPGIDKAKISDLDKKRILRNIEAELAAKGMTKSEEPDLLISIFTKERERVDVYNNYWGWGWGYGWGYGWGWGPGFYGGYYGPSVTTNTEGTLFIDMIDAKTNQLVWQGTGTADLATRSVEKKKERIREIVRNILAKYPPDLSSD